MDGAAGPPQGPEEEETAAAATAPGPGPGGNKFADIRRLLAEGAFPPAFGSIKRKNLKRYAQKFVLEGGRLYYVGMKKEEKREVVVDPERRRQVFLESHFTESGHHLGQKKTVHRIQRHYYWLGIVKDVVDWVLGIQERMEQSLLTRSLHSNGRDFRHMYKYTQKKSKEEKCR